MRPLRVLHLVGSPTSDFHADLSRLYARDCLAATADPARYTALIAYVTPDGRWRFPADLSDEAIAAAPPLALAEAVVRLVSLDLDLMVPQLFCLAGMTHHRALFDVVGIPYVGNTADVMALTADKAKAKAVVAAAGVRVPAGEVRRQGDDRHPVALPVVVKPLASDNSLGVSLVRHAREYPAALAAAWAHGDALVEAYVELGREVRCATLVRDGQVVCLPLEEYEVDPVDKPVRSAADKLARGADDQLHLVAKDPARAWIVRTDDPVTAAVWDAAVRCHEALRCRHYGLFDFRIDPDGRPWFLEAGLYCSFATQSVVAVMAAAAGIGLPELFATAIVQALDAHAPDHQTPVLPTPSGAMP